MKSFIAGGGGGSQNGMLTWGLNKQLFKVRPLLVIAESNSLIHCRVILNLLRKGRRVKVTRIRHT